jgi:uncharacterized protein YndB with AHSA1/START domain
VPTWKQQTIVEAPVQSVWALLADPARYPEWNPESIEVTGVPTKIERGSTFTNTTSGPLGKATTVFEVEELEDMHEIKLRCQTSGYYSHWILTEARGNTFADVEMGIEPPRLAANFFRLSHNKSYLRRITDETLDNLRAALKRG